MAYDEGIAERLREVLASHMDVAEKKTFGGMPLRGHVYVDPEGFESDDDLAEWLRLCLDFVTTLPAK